MKERVLELIEALKNDTEFNNIDIYEGQANYWEYYFIIRGFCGNRYFYVEISKMKNYPESHKLDISNFSDCKKEIGKKLKEFKITSHGDNFKINTGTFKK